MSENPIAILFVVYIYSMSHFKILLYRNMCLGMSLSSSNILRETVKFRKF